MTNWARPPFWEDTLSVARGNSARAIQRRSRKDGSRNYNRNYEKIKKKWRWMRQKKRVLTGRNLLPMPNNFFFLLLKFKIRKNCNTWLLRFPRQSCETLEQFFYTSVFSRHSKIVRQPPLLPIQTMNGAGGYPPKMAERGGWRGLWGRGAVSWRHLLILNTLSHLLHGYLQNIDLKRSLLI